MKTKKIISIITALFIAAGAAGCSAQNTAEKKDVTSGSSSVTNNKDADKGVTGGTEEKGTPEGSSSLNTERTADAEADTDMFAGEAAFDAAAESAERKSMTADDKTAAADRDDIIINDLPMEPSGEESSVTAEAGLLTAGEWNDNNNWGFFSNLVKSGTISFPSYNVDPRYRTVVTAKDSSGKAVGNAKVRLLDKDGKILWEAVTDKNGVAYLFGADESSGTSVEVENAGKKQVFELTAEKAADEQNSGSQTGSRELDVKLENSSAFSDQCDVMFILDATGSMSDEMMFLQKEFTAITEEIGTDKTRYSVNFYRDKTDDYVTRCFDFTTDTNDLQKKLNNETAAGGGDLPEAVADIIEETVNKSSWDNDSVKLAFLIFDAPPHDEDADRVAAAVKNAAKKGIRIIPVVSSNSDRNTELFARAAAVTTGGTYVFLTDDSGIGESHLEPIIGDYKVEKLYDIIIRIINEYR